MQKSLILVLVIIVLAVGAGVAAFVYTGNDDKDAALDTTTAVTEETSSTEAGEDPEVTAGVANDKHLQGANIGQTVDASAQSEATIEIDDFIFKTTTLKVKKGTAVTWINNGRVQHDVTSTTNSPKQGLSSEMLGNGEKYSFTFNEAGMYQYFCSPHPTQMRGVVEVVE
jgi:plastocyanin